MTDAERIIRVQSFFVDGVLPDGEASAYLDQAKHTVLNRLYPFTYTAEAEIPARYEADWCELAARLFSRKGGLGETQHSENGISRVWGTSNDEDLLQRIVPYAKVR